MANEPILFMYGYGAITKYIAEQIDTEGHMTDIAANSMISHMSSVISLKHIKEDVDPYMARVRARDLVLYSHWPVKTKRFFEILEKGS